MSECSPLKSSLLSQHSNHLTQQTQHGYWHSALESCRPKVLLLPLPTIKKHVSWQCCDKITMKCYVTTGLVQNKQHCAMGKSPAALKVMTFQTSKKVPLPGCMHMQVSKQVNLSFLQQQNDWLQTRRALPRGSTTHRVPYTAQLLACHVQPRHQLPRGEARRRQKRGPAHSPATTRHSHCQHRAWLVLEAKKSTVKYADTWKCTESWRSMGMYGERQDQSLEKMYWQAESKEENAVRASFKTAGNGALKPYRSSHFLADGLKGCSNF